MLNQVVIIGRIVNDLVLNSTETQGKSVVNITLAVDRDFKNTHGERETDFIDCILWNGIAENTTKYCNKGDLIGIKGRIQARVYEDSTGRKKYKQEIVAEKVTFLQTKTKGEE